MFFESDCLFKCLLHVNVNIFFPCCRWGERGGHPGAAGRAPEELRVGGGGQVLMHTLRKKLQSETFKFFIARLHFRGFLFLV